MSLDSMMAEVASQVGYTERSGGVSKYGAWFAEQVGDSSYRTGDWCAMGQLWCAAQSGNLDALGGARKDWAWVPSWWEHWRSIGRSGDSARRGALVFFDFNGTGDPEHVGICRGTSGGSVLTTEFNTSNACRNRSRSPGDVIGYGYPDYPTWSNDDFWMG